jgi:hypothetical protein
MLTAFLSGAVIAEMAHLAIGLIRYGLALRRQRWIREDVLRCVERNP